MTEWEQNETEIKFLQKYGGQRFPAKDGWTVRFPALLAHAADGKWLLAERVDGKATEDHHHLLESLEDQLRCSFTDLHSENVFLSGPKELTLVGAGGRR
jgi:hypothetical protein